MQSFTNSVPKVEAFVNPHTKTEEGSGFIRLMLLEGVAFLLFLAGCVSLVVLLSAFTGGI